MYSGDRLRTNQIEKCYHQGLVSLIASELVEICRKKTKRETKNRKWAKDNQKIKMSFKPIKDGGTY